ncbi:hypothetical protein FACS189499_08660 [Clostridia bacterium]|nr:hypothetical protein FACS189499_08660 [Clostridia bacterium]
MTMTEKTESILLKVKANAVIAFDDDDELIHGYIRAALDYAKAYQKVKRWTAANIPPSTEQAVIILATHWYESRDGSTGGFFADTASAGGRVWETVQTLLKINRNIEV